MVHIFLYYILVLSLYHCILETMINKLSHVGLFLKSAITHWINHSADRYSAALSFYAVFSIAPVILLTIAVGGFIFGEAALQGEIVSYLSSIIGPDSATLIERIIADAQISGGQFISIVIGIGFLLFSALRAISELEFALNDMLMFDSFKQSSDWKKNMYDKFISLLILVGFGIYILAFVIGQYIIGIAVDALPLASAMNTTISQSLLLILQIAITTLFISLLYRYIPQSHIPWKRVIPGALVTAILLLIGQVIIQYVLQIVPIGSSLGIAGSLIALMLWVYYSVMIFLFGVSITHVYSATHTIR